MNKSFTVLAVFTAMVLITGVVTMTMNTAIVAAADKRIKIDFNINVNAKNGKDGKDGSDGTNGSDGAPGTNGRDGTDGTNGNDGAPGATGNSTVQVCEEGTENCTSADLANGDTLQIVVNATGIVSANTTNPVPEPEPVVCAEGETNVNGTCVTSAPPIDNGTLPVDNGTIIPPVDNGTGVVDNGTGVVDNGTGTGNTTDTGDNTTGGNVIPDEEG